MAGFKEQLNYGTTGIATTMHGKYFQIWQKYLWDADTILFEGNFISGKCLRELISTNVAGVWGDSMDGLNPVYRFRMGLIKKCIAKTYN